MRSSYYLLILAFVSISCKQEKYDLINFDPRNLIVKEFMLSEIAEDINYIPLDNRDPLAMIHDNIEVVNNSIYLSDRYMGLLVFDKTGKMIRRIGSKGRGPGEYIYSFNFTVDEKTETIYVCDNNIIKVYSKNGQFIRSFPLKMYGDLVYRIKFINSTLFAFFLDQFENAENKWITVDSLGNLTKKEIRKTPAFTCNSTVGHGAYIFQDKVSYWNSFNDTVFSILPDLTEKPSIILTPGDHRFPKSQINIPIEDLSNYLSVRLILETDHYSIIQYNLKEKKQILFVKKENKESYLFNWEYNGRCSLINDLDGGPGFVPKIYFKENGSEFLAGFLNSIQFKSFLTSEEFKRSVPKYPEKKNVLEKMVDNFNETDNPVLIIIKLK
jgi:hypothetical protein